MKHGAVLRWIDEQHGLCTELYLYKSPGCFRIIVLLSLLLGQQLPYLSA